MRRYDNILTFLNDFGISYHLYPVACSTFDEDEQPSDKLADLVPRSYRSTVTEMQEPYNRLAMEKSAWVRDFKLLSLLDSVDSCKEKYDILPFFAMQLTP